MSASFCMNGISSSRRSKGVSDVRYFSRNIEATSSCDSALMRSKRRCSVRRTRELPLAEFVTPSNNMNTAANTTTRNPMTGIACMLPPALASVVRQREHAHGQIDAANRHTLVERRHDARSLQPAQNGAFCLDPGTAESEYLRHGHDIALHTTDFLNTDHATFSIVPALHPNDDIDR